MKKINLKEYENLMQINLKDKRNFGIQLREAQEFFFNNQPNYKSSFKTELDENPYADKDGLVEFIVGTELVNDPVVMDNLSKQKKILVALTSIVTNYVNKYAEQYGPGFKTDADLWALAMSKLPLMGPSKIDQQTYSRKLKGLEIATDFINFILDVVASEGTSALDSFKDYLSKQGDALKFGIEKNKDYYKTITIGVSVEVFKVGDQIVYTPKIKQYRINFDRENSKWSGACASYEEVDIYFDYLYCANIFDYESLEDPEIKKAFDDFVNGNQKAQIEDSSTFFNGDFPAKNPTT